MVSIFFLEQFSANGQWTLKKIHTIIEQKKYSCCPDQFSQIEATFIFKRKPLFFLLYLILPCLLISTLILLVFVIPPSSGERLGLGITVILNMSVYLLVVSDHLPQSSDESPLLGVYYVMMIYEMTIAFILSGVTLWISTWKIDMPKFVQYLFFKLPKQIKQTHHRVLVSPSSDKIRSPSKHESVVSKRNRSFHEEFELKKTKIEGAEPRRIPAVEKEQSWEKVGRKLDKFFFIFFFLLFLFTSIGVVLVRPDVGYGFEEKD